MTTADTLHASALELAQRIEVSLSRLRPEADVLEDVIQLGVLLVLIDRAASTPEKGAPPRPERLQ